MATGGVRRGADADWSAYLDDFHDERAGITEDVLEHALDARGRTAYDWAADALPTGVPVLDLACGSAPMAARLGDRYLAGLDVSPAELRAAHAKGVPVARADAVALPLPDASVEAVVMSMALMLVPLEEALSEVRRVLRPGGLLVATTTANRPVPLRDWLRYARLCAALRHLGLAYPNDRPLRDAAGVFERAGLALVDDEARAFRCPLASPERAELLLASLYLPDVGETRLDAGRGVVRRWVGSSITTPVRRLVARG